jgi:hypothetical protein
MARFLAGLSAGAITAALIAIVVLYFADLEIVEEDSGPETPTSATKEVVEVPSVVGLDRIDAETEIAAAGLEVEIEQQTRPYDQVFRQPGARPEVTRQSPLAGTELDADDEVRIVLGLP